LGGFGLIGSEHWKIHINLGAVSRVDLACPGSELVYRWEVVFLRTYFMGVGDAIV